MTFLTKPPTDLVRSVDRTLTLLQLIGSAPTGLTTGETADRCDFGIWTVRHHLATLAYKGYARRWDDERYTLGPAFVDRGHDLAVHLSTRHAAGTSPAEMADWFDQPPALTIDLLRHGADAVRGTCVCVTSGHRVAPERRSAER